LGVGALCLPFAAAASGGSPELTAVAQKQSHVLVTFSLGDLSAPAEARISTRAAVGANGALLRQYVKLHEAIHATADPTTGIVHWKSRGVLRPGLYYVQVSGVAAGVTSCVPVRSTCGLEWSNVKRLRMPAPPVHQVPSS
jgi:hypothetical protein